jgi:alginate O-acetyltransferase complex protein AlgI
LNAYLPTSPFLPWLLLAGLVATLLLGLVIVRVRSAGVARGLAWGQAVALVAVVERSCVREPPGVRMLAIIAFLLYAMKTVVLVEWARQGHRLSPGRQLAFAAGWPGMRPALFRTLRGPTLPGACRLVARSALWLIAGLALVGLARAVWVGSRSLLLATVPLLTGLSLILHFGLFGLTVGLWRLLGVPCEPLFRAPLRSRSLREFWARRWNLAFSEMTALAVFRPVTERLGRSVGTMAAFLFSGLLHELAISLPVKAGFGGPLLYFALHGVAVLLEGHLDKKGVSFLASPWASRLWVVAWLVLPLPILFHPPFLHGVVWPLLGTLH